MKKDTFRIVIFLGEAGGKKVYIAQGIDKDLCTQGEDVVDVFNNFRILLELNCKHDNFVNIPPSPDTFKEMYLNGNTIEPVKNYQSSFILQVKQFT